MEIIKAQFKEIADAIRLKNHTTAAIPATELANEIKRVDLGMTAKSEIKADGTQILHIVKRDTQNTTGVLPSSGNFKKLHCYLAKNERGFYTLHMEDYIDQPTDNYMVGYVPNGDQFQLYLVEI
jgi:2-C-methyl-D-erythritol 4-phosphate cytidylyltransferase